MDKKRFSEEIYKRYNVIKRGRNCFLYTKKEVRLTDMYQENGRAILGWDGKEAFTHFKNAMNRGIMGSFITEDHSRLEKAVSQLLNSPRKVYFFSSKSDAIKAGVSVASESSGVYIPWAPYEANLKETKAVTITPPFPWTDSIYILAIATSLVPDSSLHFSGQIEVPYPLQAGITRGIYNLIQELPLRQEKDWFIYDPVLTKYWTRKGPYLYTKVPADKYDAFVLHCLDCGIIINPEPEQPSIVPYGADKGVFTNLKNNPFNFQE